MEPRRARLTRLLLLSVISLPITACSTAAPATLRPPSSPAAAAAAACANAPTQVKTPGQITFSTTDPAYEPWFEDDPDVQYAVEPSDAPKWHVTDPYSMHGFESGVVYSIADSMGFAPEAVRWVPNTRDAALAPGDKNFDVFIGQVAIPDGDSTAVDFSEEYLESVQSIVAQRTNPIVSAKTIADLKAYRLGAIGSSASPALVTNVIAPTTPVQTYLDEVTAVAAMRRGDIDGFVTDLATAFFQINGPGSGDPAPLPDGVVFGKFAPTVWVDHLGVVLQKGSPLTPCVNAAIEAIRANGSLDEFQNEDIPVGEDVPTFQ